MSDCPFKLGAQMQQTECKRTCTLRRRKSCLIAIGYPKPKRDTLGENCAIVGKCVCTCAMYDNGCKIYKLVKGIDPERK